MKIGARPDTQPPVADGWAGVDMRVFPLFDSCLQTDGPTDRRTDKASYRVVCPQLKIRGRLKKIKNSREKERKRRKKERKKGKKRKHKIFALESLRYISI